MNKFIAFLKAKVKALKAKRLANTTDYKATNLILTLAFPLFICSLVEIIQMKSVSRFIEFLFDKPSIFVFNLFFVSVIFYGICILVKKVHISTTVCGLLLTTASIAELFKFNTSGNHLMLSDVKMVMNFGSLTKFAYIKITPHLLTMVIILLVYLGCVYYFNPVVKLRIKKRMVTGGVCVATIAVMLFAPVVAFPVYSFFNIDTKKSNNAFSVNEKFDNNNFLAFLAQTTTEFLNSKVKKPDDYSKEVINDYLKDSDTTDESFKKPNVIFIMSEAFADFRRFKNLDIDPSIYEAYDRIAQKSFKGTTAVSTFASFTVKTEFELLFGLPVKSLNDPNMPQRLLQNRQQQTMPSYYKSLGYNTTYIHPFYRGFYSRDKVYDKFGFDDMIFDDNFTVEKQEFRTYISDRTVFNQIEQKLKETKGSDYIYVTTMQNHQPYVPSQDSTMSELDYYLDGVKDMLSSLEEFITDLENSDEPTIVMFVGDHYPCFKGENSAYDQIGITSENANEVYLQPYLIWNNFNADMSKAPENTVSSFYLPYVVMDAINAPKNEIYETVFERMKTVPVYTTNYNDRIPDDKILDMLTYDIILGKKYVEEVEDE